MTTLTAAAYLRSLVAGGRRRRWVCLTAAATVASTAAQLSLPVLVGLAIDEGLAQRDPGALDRITMVLAAVALAGYVASRAKMLAGAHLAQGVLAQTRIDVFGALHRRSLPEVEAQTPGRILALLTADLAVLEQAATTVLPTVTATLAALVVATVVLLVVSPVLFAASLVTLPLVVLAFGRFRRRSRRVYRRLRERTADAVAALDEELAGAAVAQAYGRVADRAARFDAVNDAVLGSEIEAVWTRNWFNPVVELSAGVATASVVAVGGRLAIDGRFGISIGVITAFALSLSSLYQPMQRLGFVLDAALSAKAALDRIAQFVVSPAGLPRRDDPVPLPRMGALVVDHAWFSYDGEHPVLRDVSLTVEAGERIAIVGRTGAGKSTLAALLARLADPTAGAVRFGGVPLADADPEELRTRIRLVVQDGLLLPGTVADNLRLVDPAASDHQLASTLESLDAHRTLDPQRDVATLSTGEAQLVALARIALADPSVVILDEATSAVDPGAEAMTDKVLAGRTAIVIAHRPATAARCERVVVVDDGAVVADGPPADLLAPGAPWRSLLAGAGGPTSTSRLPGAT